MGGQGSGGANGGPQYNPANVSATGGAGQSGNYTGFAYGQNKAVNDSRVQGNRALRNMAPEEPATPTPQMTPVTPITAETELPDQSVMHGSTPDTAHLRGIPAQQGEDPDMNTVRNYFPMMEAWANQPDTPQSTKEYINYLRTIL
jgi:hypothetical protein